MKRTIFAHAGDMHIISSVSLKNRILVPHKLELH